MQKLRFGLLAIVLTVLLAGRVSANPEYDPAACAQVLGTLDIHWEAVGGAFAPCTGVEFTDGTLMDAADGSITMSGTSVSNGACIGTDTYTLTMSGDGLSLNGNASGPIPMNLTRTPDQACFVGHWVSGADDYLAHIAAGPFGAAVVPAVVPTLSPWAVTFLILALLAVGRTAIATRRSDSF